MDRFSAMFGLDSPPPENGSITYTIDYGNCGLHLVIGGATNTFPKRDTQSLYLVQLYITSPSGTEFPRSMLISKSPCPHHCRCGIHQIICWPWVEIENNKKIWTHKDG